MKIVDEKLELLDLHPRLPFLFLTLLPFAVRLPQWLLGLSTDPIIFWSGVTNGVKSGLLPGLPFLDPNAGFTTEALGNLAAWDWVHGIVPWWNPYSGIGMPLAGEMQPGAFFLPFILLLLLPNGVLWLQIAMQIITGFATYALLRELSLTRLTALMGAALFALDGTIAWTPGPVAISCVVPFLPLLLWGIERARKPRGQTASVLAIGVAIAWSIFAGFPETAYLDGLLALAWTAYRFARESQRAAFVQRVIGGGMLGLLVAAPLIIAFTDDLLQSTAFGHHNWGEAALPWSAWPTIFLPYVFGSPAEPLGSEQLSSIWGNVGGYIGILIVPLAISCLAIKSTNRGLATLLLIWILVCWAKTFGVQPIMSLINHIPFLTQTAFYRYSPPTWELAAIILAALGLDGLRRDKPFPIWVFGVPLGVLVIAVVLAWPQRTFWGWSEDQAASMLEPLGFSLMWGLAGLIAAFWIGTALSGERRRVTMASLLLFDSVVLFALPEMTGSPDGTIDAPGIQFLRDHQALSRSYSLGPINPNYGAFFRIANIDHNALPVPSLWADYVDRNLLPGLISRFLGVSFWPGFYGAGVGEKALHENLGNYLNVGVRYVIAQPETFTPVELLPTAESDNQPLVLQAGQSVSLKARTAPPAVPDSLITAVGVMIGNFFNTSDGALMVRLCNKTACQSGQRLLVESSDNTIFPVILDKPLSVSGETILDLTITHQGGIRPVTLWLWPEVAGAEQQLQGPEGALKGQALRINFQLNTAGPSLHKAYSDAVMDIWELEDPAPYFEVEDGGPCILSFPLREDVTADCATPARLRRRELFTPGWQASINGTLTEVTQDEEIFQAVSLPTGHSQIHYHFAPPYIRIGWTSSLLGLIGLLGQAIHGRCRTTDSV